MATFKGVVKARIVDVRFATSGRLTVVKKFTGDSVKKGDLLACLDRKVLQTTLDRELADFEKVRADFEIFNQKNPNPTEAIDKYLKTEKQAMLNASVKSVELAKANLDQCDLFSPVEGIVMDDSNVIAGLNITPAGSSFKIIDTSSYFVEIEIKEKDFENFQKPRDVVVRVQGIGKTIKSQTSQVLSDSKRFYVRVPVSGDGLLVGLPSEVKN
jgi:multidrug resistance efflux pump